MENITFMMIKPDAVENGFIGNIIEKVTSLNLYYPVNTIKDIIQYHEEVEKKLHKVKI